MSSWAAWLSSLPPPSYSRPSPASPLPGAREAQVLLVEQEKASFRWRKRRGQPCRSGWQWSQSPWQSWPSLASLTASSFPCPLKSWEIQQINSNKIFTTKKCRVQSREIHLAAGYPPGTRGCDSLFQPPPHMHDRVKNSLSSDRAGLREAAEGVVKAAEYIRTGAFSSPLFLATDWLHLKCTILIKFPMKTK